MSHQQVFEQFKKRAENASPLGGKLKFLVDKNPVLIDGSGDENIISMSDDEADCTIEVTQEVLEKLRDGEINPMMAVMGGQIKITGDMGLAMKVQSLIDKLLIEFLYISLSLMRFLLLIRSCLNY